MNYQEFKDYLVTFLWKTGDAALVDNLDAMVSMATQELNRRLDVTRRVVELTTVSVTSEMFDLPDDFRHMIYFGVPNKQFSNVTLWALENGPVNAAAYHTSGGKLYTRRSAYPFAAQIQYRTNLPDFKATNASWMADEFLDVYTYTVLKHTAPFLREDERIPVWQNFSELGIGTMLEEDKHQVEFGGSPILPIITRANP